jgi:hypothetical protein
LDEQQKFLNLCLKNCMVTNPDLMKRSRYLLELCTEFSDFILDVSLLLLKITNYSFKLNIDHEFKQKFKSIYIIHTVNKIIIFTSNFDVLCNKNF